MENETATPVTSRSYAKQLRELADWMDSRPEFTLPNSDRTTWTYFRFWDKEPFLAAVRAIGAGEKKFDGEDIKFSVRKPFGTFMVCAPRNALCRLIRAAEYECDPLLSPEEEQSIGGAS